MLVTWRQTQLRDPKIDDQLSSFLGRRPVSAWSVSLSMKAIIDFTNKDHKDDSIVFLTICTTVLPSVSSHFASFGHLVPCVTSITHLGMATLFQCTSVEKECYTTRNSA